MKVFEAAWWPTDVSCDMSPAFIKGVYDNLPTAEITFDKKQNCKSF